MTRPPPGAVNAEAEAQARKLGAIVRSARVLGLCFFGFGLLALAPAFGPLGLTPLALLIASSLMSSGVMYVVFATFLRKRRHWAWVATLAMTIVMLLIVCVFAVITAGEVWNQLRRAVEPEISEVLFFVFGPAVWIGSWIAALILILRYLFDALPAVREQEAVAQKGFAVIPVAELAPVGESPDAARGRAR